MKINYEKPNFVAILNLPDLDPTYDNYLTGSNRDLYVVENIRLARRASYNRIVKLAKELSSKLCAPSFNVYYVKSHFFGLFYTKKRVAFFTKNESRHRQFL